MPRIVDDRFALSEDQSRAGGMATVYRAHDLQRDATVAVKVFNVRHPVERLVEECLNRELQSLMGPSHPNIVDLIDWGKDDGQGCPYLVFDWFDKDLLHLIEDAPFGGWDDFAPYAIGILRGLEALHARSIAHRDIKPQNVLIGADGTPKLTDFGISKLQSSLSMGFTLGGYGSPPYAPPEEDDGRFTFSRDIFAFAVLTLSALHNRLMTTREEIPEALASIDVPPEISELLRSCLEDAPERPQTAAVVLAVVEPFQHARETRRARQMDVFLWMPGSVKERIASTLILPLEEVEDAVREDLEASVIVHDEPREDKAGVLRDSDLLIAGGLFRYRARPDDRHKGRLAIVDVARVTPSQLDWIRERGWRGHLRYLLTPPGSEDRAFTDLGELMTQVMQATAEASGPQSVERATLFRGWKAILDAQRAIEESRGEPIRYSSREVSGRRVIFQTASEIPEQVIGQPRLVRLGREGSVAGEVEDVSRRSLVLFVERGNPVDVPQAGEILFDSEATKVAIERQRAALDAVRFGRSVRPDLGELLLSPASASPPTPVQGLEFAQQDLDEFKKRAVSTALGSSDFTVVNGPPGTGKTTLIAEVVAQTLRVNPAARILVSSQTHVALDNAVERIARLVPDQRMSNVRRSGVRTTI